MSLSQFHQRAPLVSFSIFFIFGILFQSYFSLPIGLVLGMSMVLLVLIWFIHKDSSLLIFLWTLTAVGGMARMAVTQTNTQKIESIVSQLHNNEVEISGEVLSKTKREQGWKYLLKNQEIKVEQFNWTERIAVFLYTDEVQPVEVGQQIIAQGIFLKLSRPRNPGEFNFAKFYHRQNIWGRIIENKFENMEVGVKVKNLNNIVHTVQMNIRDLFKRVVGGDAGNLLVALIVGLREEVPKEIKQDFVDTGVIHVLAVSGLHVGYVLVIVMVLVKLFRFPFGLDKVMIILLLFGYAILTGGKSSVLRATIMASLYVLSPLFQRKGNMWNIIAATTLGLLIYDSRNLFDVGFLLSFSAVISIIFFYKQFEILLPERIKVSHIKNRVIKYTFALFLVSLSAQIGTFPFTWYFFNRIPIISLIANVFIVPLIGVLVALGFAILLLGSWIPVVDVALGNSAWLIAQVIFLLTNFFSKIPFAYFELATPSFFQILQYIAVIGTIFIFLRVGWRKYRVLATLLCMNLFVWPWALHRSYLDVIFLDVGEGDATFLQIPTNQGKRIILVDTGLKNFRNDMGERVILPVSKHLGIKNINLLILSHPHTDHIGGAETVLNNIKIDEIWDTYSNSNYYSEVYENVINLIKQDTILYHHIEKGAWEDNFSPAQIFILHPDSLYCVNQTNVNNMSIVFKLLYGQVSFLFVGDLEAEGEGEVIHFGNLIESNVLKVGHHGSITGTTEPFLKWVQPDYAIISVGERNKFDHPSPEVIERLKDIGAMVLRTDQEGAIWLKSDGKRVWRYDWR